MQTYLVDKTYLKINSNGNPSIENITEEENSMSMDVWTNKTLRFRIPTNVSDKTIQEVITEIKPYLDRLYQGHIYSYEKEQWILSEDAKEMSFLIEEHLLNLPTEISN
ncbi:hypothetical protein LEP1GSC132_0008 [Leptospira kirschneri str. 200803703]|uniref:hypothetical protein n=1 Tax=Leptospira kirschneri TaxID=29507 RepID=UPI0002BD981A|nr:hypothetical protein [Leptospira kirschneri]EMO66606.1 hypothetical protein LEP1GSC132_0008 [Leptospira kirschneri str. 200803703]